MARPGGDGHDDLTTMHSSSGGAAPLDLQKGNHRNKQQPAAVRSTRVLPVVLGSAIVDVCLAAASLAGAALLTWWALRFHPAYAQLWMVPVGLVLACTPVVVCVALHCSPDTREPPPLSAVVVVNK